MLVRFFLDSLEIDEPQGWSSLEISIKRDDDFHGIGFEASTNQLDFYGIGRQYINYIKATQGLKASITFRAEEACAGDTETILQGRLNMGKYRERCGTECFVSLPIETESCEATFRNKFEQKVDVDKLRTQNGIGVLEAYAQLGITIQLPTKNIDYRSNGAVAPAGDTEPVVFSTPGGGSEAYALVRPEYVEENTNIHDTHLTGGTNIGYSGPHGIFIPLSSQVLFNEDNANCFLQPILVNGRLKGRITMPGVSNLDVYSVRLNGELDGEWPINDPNQDIEQTTLGIGINTDVDGPFEFDVSMTSLNWMPLNNGADGIYFYLALHQNPGANFNGTVVFDPETFISFTTVQACPPTDTKSYLVHELLSRVTENITDNCMRVKSSFYGRTDSQPFAFDRDGCGALRMATSGLKIRNADKATFFISPSDLINGLRCIDNIGMGVEPDTTIPGRFLLRIEDLDFFYQDFEIFRCVGITLIDTEVEEARDFSLVKVGYKKWQTLANFGLDEFNSDRQYHLAIQTINNALDITSVLVAGEYPITVTREQQFASSSSIDTTYDDENFIICLKRLTYNTFIVEQGGIVNPQNIFNPETVYNYRISPVRNLMNWYRSLINAYPTLGDSVNKLYFSSGTGNIFASGQLFDGYGYSTDLCKKEAVDIKENMDLFVTAFRDVLKYTPLWRNETVTFDYPMSFKNYNAIKDKRYGYISYQCGNGEFKKGWIKNITWNPGPGNATFVLRKKWEPETVPNFVFPPAPVNPDPDDLALEITFDSDISELPLGLWNSIFDTPINASTPFTSVEYINGGVTARLKGATNLIIKDALFLDTSTVIKVEDFVSCVIEIRFQAFGNCINFTTAYFPACTVIGAETFTDDDALQVLYFPICTNIGGTVGDDSVFNGTNGATITFTLPSSQVSDGDVVTLQANNTVTLNPV